MRNLLRPVPGLGPTPAGRVPSFRKVKEIKGLRGTVLKYGAQEIPQIDPPEAEKRDIYGWNLAGSFRNLLFGRHGGLPYHPRWSGRPCPLILKSQELPCQEDVAVDGLRGALRWIEWNFQKFAAFWGNLKGKWPTFWQSLSRPCRVLNRAGEISQRMLKDRCSFFWP